MTPITDLVPDGASPDDLAAALRQLRAAAQGAQAASLQLRDTITALAEVVQRNDDSA